MNKVFGVLWRLAILSLPWQTRWFSDATLGGWPWEQGRISIYASWVLIIAAILFSLKLKSRKCHSEGSRDDEGIRGRSFDKLRMTIVFILFVLSIIATRFDLNALKAVGMWWVQIGILSLFVYSLWREKVSLKQIVAWFCISLLPHAILGIEQFISQEVVASTSLGIAAQLPASLGVSVVELDGVRTLRVYGGFPHPNIFGGWLVVGALSSIWLATKSSIKTIEHKWSTVAALFSVALVLTFSRSAILAFCVGLFLIIAQLVRKKSRIGFPVMLVLTAFFGAMFLQQDLIASRFVGSERLEVKSIEMRVESSQTFVEVFKDNAWIGTGPNSELYSLSKTLGEGDYSAPLEPPHNVFFLALVNFGIIGVIILVLILKRFPLRKARFEFLIPILVLGLFDHYLWSTWAGQTLGVLTILMIFGNITHEKDR